MNVSIACKVSDIKTGEEHTGFDQPQSKKAQFDVMPEDTHPRP